MPPLHHLGKGKRSPEGGVEPHEGTESASSQTTKEKQRTPAAKHRKSLACMLCCTQPTHWAMPSTRSTHLRRLLAQKHAAAQPYALVHGHNHLRDTINVPNSAMGPNKHRPCELQHAWCCAYLTLQTSPRQVPSRPLLHHHCCSPNNAKEELEQAHTRRHVQTTRRLKNGR